MPKDRNEKKLNDYREEKRNPLNKYNDPKLADEIPLEDLKIETEQENRNHTQDDSQSTNKYQADFDKNKN